MFHVMRRVLPAIPATAVISGWIGQPLILLLPPAAATGFLLWRDAPSAAMSASPPGPATALPATS